MTLDQKFPYYWLDNKPETLEEGYLFQPKIGQNEPVKTGVATKLIGWCFG